MSIKLVDVSVIDTTGAKPGSNLVWVSSNASFEWVQGLYVPTIAGTNWANTPTEAKLTASDAQIADYFGIDVDINANATYAISTAYLEDGGSGDPINQAGAGYVYTRSGSTWTEQAKLVASDAEAVDRLGYRGAISSDGTYVIIGAYLRSNPLNDAGAAYIFKRTGTSWSQEAKLTASDAQVVDQFGISVDINSNGAYAISGARHEDGGTGDPRSEEGAAYVYTRSGSTWTEQAILRPSDGVSSAYFGHSVAMTDNADYVIVGAYGYNAAYVYTRSGSTWTQQAKLVGSDVVSGDQFGHSVSINANGTYAVVSTRYKSGGPSDSVQYAGAAYVFKRSGSTWTQQAKLTASDADYEDYFGDKVSINSDGTRIVVGCALEDGGDGDPLSNAGAIYVFARTEEVYWVEQAKITSSDLQAEDRFGSSVSINDDGTYIIAGAYFEDGGSGDPLSAAGAAYVFNAQ